MSARRKMPLPMDFKSMVLAEPGVTVKQWAGRYGATETAVRSTAKKAGVRIRRAPVGARAIQPSG